MRGRGGGLVIVGVSTRALAESAVRAGRTCSAVDAFGDRDHKASAAVIGLARDLGRRYSAGAAAAAAARVPAGDAAYVANLENHPEAVRRLMAGRRLLGNPPAVLVRARDPMRLACAVRAAGGRAPTSFLARAAAGSFVAHTAAPTRGPEAAARGDAAPTATSPGCRSVEVETDVPPTTLGDGPAGPAHAWLRKPRRGGGGSGIAQWSPAMPLAPHEFVQEWIDGVPASAVFVADGRRAVVLGLARQLFGEPAFGAPGFRFCGCLFPLHAPGARDTTLLERVRALADALTAAFDLRGVNGLDFVVRDGEPWVLELNPRYTASMELIERACDLSIYNVHERACGGELPDFDAATAPAAVFGKAVVFAHKDVVAGETVGWLGRDDVRDVPFPGDLIRSGGPICSAFADGPDAHVCYARLVATAERLRNEIDGRGNEIEGRGDDRPRR